MKTKITAIAITLALLTSACQPQDQYSQRSGVGGTGFNKQQVGTVLGGVGGGILGNQLGKGKGNTAATIGGTVLGAMLGNSMGKSLDNADAAYAQDTAQYAFENGRTGVSSSWTNPDSGNRGTITPTRTYQNSYGANCREFSQSVNVGGQTQRGYGTACRQSDGSWQIVNN